MENHKLPFYLLQYICVYVYVYYLYYLFKEVLGINKGHASENLRGDV